MRKKIMKYFGVFIMFVIAGGIITAKPCLAASAKIDISSDASDVTVGDSFFVYLTINSDTKAGDFEANLSYDDDVLEYQSGSSAVTGSSGFLRISDIDVTEGTTERKYTLKFKAASAGVSEISLNGRAMVYDYDDGSEMSVSSNILSIKVKAAETASSNANLQSLKISPSELSPAFDKKTFEYSTNVNYDIQKLIVDATPEDSKASVSISGNDFLKEGENKIIITVLAESGAVIEYNINVNKAKAPNDGTANPTTIPSDAVANSLKVEQINGENFAIYEGRYKLVEPGSEVIIPKGYVKSKIIISDISLTAFYPENNLDSDFLLIYAENETGEAGFYQYDKKEKTLQRYISSEDSESVNVANPNTDEIMQSEKYHANLNKAALVIAVLSVICILLIVALINLLTKKRGNTKRSSRKR